MLLVMKRGCGLTPDSGPALSAQEDVDPPVAISDMRLSHLTDMLAPPRILFLELFKSPTRGRNQPTINFFPPKKVA